jgi:hypothetical protein
MPGKKRKTSPSLKQECFIEDVAEEELILSKEAASMMQEFEEQGDMGSKQIPLVYAFTACNS